MNYKKNIRLWTTVAVFGLIFLNTALPLYAETLVTVDKALKKIFRDATHFDSKVFVLSDEQIKVIEEKVKIIFGNNHSRKVQMHTAKANDQILGFAFEDTVVGKWGPIHYLAGLNPDGTVRQVIVLDYKEIRGKPIAKKRFLRQYKKKSIKDPVKLRKDIDGITGATISSRSMTNGIRKLLFIFNEYGVTMNLP